MLRNFITDPIPTWRNQLNLHTAEDTITIKELLIRSEIFQGDSLSPFIFCIALFPPSQKLHRANTGFKVGKNKILYLLYTDNLKVYAKNGEEL
eukprot:15150901-Ditylum_brightwellii.AAC.2